MNAERTRDRTRQASKYDYVKVRVWLGTDQDHYYVLSRFLVSRMLTVTKLPPLKAVKIALELKKALVDSERLNLTQPELEELLFDIMRAKGFGDQYVRRYRMFTAFHMQRRPLIVFICGTACTGKSTLAQQLAARLNLPNVLQTDVIYRLLRTTGMTTLDSKPLWDRTELSSQDLLAEYQRECGIVRRGINGDLTKCVRDGKSFVIEGLHLDPGLYLHEFGRHGLSRLGDPGPEPSPAPSATATNTAANSLASDTKRASQPVTLEADVSTLPASAAQQLWGAADLQKSLDAAAVRRIRDATEQPHSFLEPTAAQTTYQRQQVQPTGGTEAMPTHRQTPAQHSGDEGKQVCSSDAARGQSPVEGADAEAAAADAGVPSAEAGSTAPMGTKTGHRRPTAALRDRVRALKQWSHPEEPSEAPPQQPVPPGALETEASAGAAGAQRHNRRHAFAGRIKFALRQLTSREPASGDGGGATDAGISPIFVDPNQALAGWEGFAGDGTDTSDNELPSDSAAAARSDAQGQQQLRPDGTQKSVRFADERGAATCDAAVQTDPEAAPRHSGSSRGTDMGPVFIPIVLAMDPVDHRTLLNDWLRQQLGPGHSLGDASERVDEITEKLDILQRHLSSYQAYGVPLATVRMADFHSTLERLHDYLLECMELAMRPN